MLIIRFCARMISLILITQFTQWARRWFFPYLECTSEFSFSFKCDFQYSFISPEDLMKNLPKVMSNVFGASGGMSRYSPTFNISMKEYEDMAIKIGDKVGIEINKVDSSGI
jgi:hypothetical protein